ncbi:MAG: malonyl-CoA synthase [Pseudomonadota bacterium]
MSNHLYDALFAPHAGSEAPFLHFADGGVLSYGGFVDMAAGYAGALTELGIKPGDRVALQISKCPDMLALIAGCIQAGIVFLPLNTAYTAAELSYFVENSGARLLVCDPEKADDYRSMTDGLGVGLETMAWGTGTLQERAQAVTDDVPVEPRGADDLAAFLYTSGTTGRSKGAMLSHDNLLSNAQVLVDAWGFTGEDVLLHALPIFHTHGLFVGSNVMLLVGGSMIFLPKFYRDAVVALLPKATSMMGVPTFYTRLLDDGRLTPDLVSNIRLFVSGSAPLLAETHVAWEDRTGHRILERYGMTETNMNTSNPYQGERKPGTVGPALPGVEVKVCDPESGETLPQGEIGVVEVRGPNVFQGYWQMPEKTAAELRDDGFFITGDLGYLDNDGYLVIVGRGKDLIISGGFNIYPKELELVLDAQPGVLESAVVAAPHPDFGESPVAVIVPAHKAQPDLDAIAEAMRTELAAFKQPRQYVLRDALPRNTMGKVQKADLRKELEGLFT